MILTPHLGYGGIQKSIMTFLANFSSLYDIKIIVLEQIAKNPAYKIPKSVDVKYLINCLEPECSKKNNLGRKIKNIYNMKSLLIKDLKNNDYDYIITINGIFSTIINKYSKAKKVNWEHAFPTNPKIIDKIAKKYRSFDYLISVSEKLVEIYQTKLVKTKCVYIPNVIDKFSDEVSKLETNNIITVGNLTKDKNLVELIEVFKLVSLKIPTSHLDIIGDGPEKSKIEDKIRRFHLEDNVTLHGFKSEKYVDRLLNNASIYVLTSLKESFGLSILEAFSHGLPSVAFDSSEGARELISNNWDGYLIPDRNYDKMTNKILELMENQNRRIIMGSQARKKALKYNSDLFKEEWMKVLNNE